MGEQSSWTAMGSDEDRMGHGTVGQSIDKLKKNIFGTAVVRS